MKNPIALMMLSLCLFLMIVTGALAIDFVPVGQADVLVITHANLRTPNWVPGMVGGLGNRAFSPKADAGL